MPAGCFLCWKKAASFSWLWMDGEFVLMNDLITSQRWIRLNVFPRRKDYYLMRKALIWLPPKNRRTHFCDMKILSPQMSSLLKSIEIVSGAAGALWLFLSCKCLAKRSGNLWLVCWCFQMDWWFNSRWLNILSSFCSQGGLRSHCHNSQWFIFSGPISLPGLVGLFIYSAWSLICQLWNTGAANGVLRDAAIPL